MSDSRNPDGAHSPRVFLLSPANCNGKRAQLVRTSSNFDLALALRRPEGALLGEVFAFVSGLYFRGKLAYARAFAPASKILVITPSDGLRSPDERITLADLERYASVSIGAKESRYRVPVERDVRRLATALEAEGGGEVVLLGSIATAKYTGVLGEHLGARLAYPREFVGRGDMSRGALLLRQARAGVQLEYEALVPRENGDRKGDR